MRRKNYRLSEILYSAVDASSNLEDRPLHARALSITMMIETASDGRKLRIRQRQRSRLLTRFTHQNTLSCTSLIHVKFNNIHNLNYIL